LQGTQNTGVLGRETGSDENDHVSSGCMSCKLYIQMLALCLNKHPRVSSEEWCTRDEVSRYTQVPHYASNSDISACGRTLT
jgi:hypothetical protein